MKQTKEQEFKRKYYNEELSDDPLSRLHKIKIWFLIILILAFGLATLGVFMFT